jgi:hypothetical protein
MGRFFARELRRNELKNHEHKLIFPSFKTLQFFHTTKLIFFRRNFV